MTSWKNASTWTFAIGILGILGSCDSASSSSVAPTDTMPAGVTPACFCTSVMSDADIYEYTSNQANKCQTMYICWDNAYIDCLMSTEQVWVECVD
jgi:hypothetical protein